MPLRAITHHTRPCAGLAALMRPGCVGAALTCLEWNRAKFEPGYVFYTPNMAQESPGYAALPLRAITHHPPHTRPCAGLAALMRLEGVRGRL